MTEQSETQAETTASSHVDVLWEGLKRARADGDLEAVRQIENRMRTLSDERRFAHLTDEALQARIDSLQGNREPTGMLAHSPGGISTEFADISTMVFNEASRANQQVGVERTLEALLTEQRRRRA